MADTSSMKDKIAKLLAKAERTTNEHEALAFREAAEKLMIKWGIELAELEARGEVKRDEIITRIIDLTGIYHAANLQFANQLVQGLGNLELLASQRYVGNKKIPTMYIIGHQSDVDRWQMLYDSLQMQCTSEMNRWWRDYAHRPYLSSMEGFKARREFIMAFARAVRQRLVAAREAERSTVSSGAELVIADKQKAVTNWMFDKYSVGKARGGRMSGTNHGRTEGHAAGSRAGLGERGIGGRGAELTR